MQERFAYVKSVCYRRHTGNIQTDGIIIILPVSPSSLMVALISLSVFLTLKHFPSPQL